MLGQDVNCAQGQCIQMSNSGTIIKNALIFLTKGKNRSTFIFMLQ